MKIKTYFIYFVLLFFCNTSNLFSLLYDPGTRSTTTFTHITSDYGPRNAGAGASNPHRGIDYRIQIGEKGYAVDDGTFKGIFNLKDYTTYILVNDWKYMHVESKKYNKIFNVYTTSDKDGSDTPVAFPEIVIVYRELSGNNYIVKHAFSVGKLNQYNARVPITFKDPISKSNVITTNQISAKQWIFMPNNRKLGKHLHLSKVDKFINPFSQVAHRNDDNPNVNLRIGKANSANKFEVISGTSVYDKIIFEGRINITNDKDLNSVIFKIKPENQSEKEMYQINLTARKKGNCEKKNIIGLGNNTNQTQSENLIKEAIEQKCYPVYISESECGLDYFKYKLNTKQRKGTDINLIALTNDEKSSDGPVYADMKYWITTKAFDITDKTSAESSAIIVDNFLPFLKRLCVKDTGGITIYNSQWKYANSAYTRELNQIIGKYKTLKTILELEFSEPIKKVNSIKVGTGVVTNIKCVSSDSKLWTAEYEIIKADYGETRVVEVIAKDLADNNLDGNPATIAYRSTNSTWANNELNNDTNHKIYFAYPEGTLRVIVKNTQGNGVPNTTVKIKSKNYTINNAFLEISKQTTSNPAGVNVFENIPSDTYTVKITKSDYMPANDTEILVKPFVETILNITIKKPAQILGTVLRTGDSAPIDSALIELTGINYSDSCYTDKKGKFKDDYVNPDTYTIKISKQHYTTQTLQNQIIEAGSTYTYNFNLVPDKAKVNVSVVGIHGSAVKNANVTFSAVRVSSSFSITTDDQGNGSQDNVEPTLYNVSITSDISKDTSYKNIDILPGDDTNLTFVVEKYGSLFGTITSKKTGNIIENAKITIKSKTRSFSKTVYSDTAGNYYIGKLIKDGYTVSVAHDSFIKPSPLDIQLDYEEDKVQDFQLNEYCILTGKVKEANTNPEEEISSASIKVLDSNSKVVFSCISEGDGSYRINRVASGSYTIKCKADGFLEKTISITLTDNQDIMQDIYLDRVLKLKGNITDNSTGGGLSGANISVSGPSSGSANSQSTGYYEISGLSTGQHTVTVSKSGYLTKTIQYNIAHG